MKAPWGTFTEDVPTGAAESAGVSFAAALLLFGAAWHTRRMLPTQFGQKTVAR
ncbi:hypothetical protein ACFU53_00040 [Streptomyces sp. NPDC057474]|uniref:hypothetical protein n=1 Tax=Streptomyces sp. NPDC057474 TaxID=3346144 RepID=UPI0036A99B95